MSETSSFHRRIVVKVDSAVLVENQRIAAPRIAQVCAFVADLKQRYEVIVVTSGAVTVGHVEQPAGRSIGPHKKALASLGQPLLMHMYYTELQKYGILCSQLLLGVYDFDSDLHTSNTRNTIEVLLAHNIVPIINENDVAAQQEERLDDNDHMSAHVAYHFGADLLVVLSDMVGYDATDPRTCDDAAVRRMVSEVAHVAQQAEAIPPNPFPTSGIVTKLQAAQFLLDHGKKMFLTDGFRLEKAREFLLDDKHASGTLFCPASAQTASAGS